MRVVNRHIDKQHIPLRWNNTYYFECQRCGDCCRSPGYFTPHGLAQAAESVGAGYREFYDRYCRLDPGDTVVRPAVSDSGYCSFLGWEDSLAVCTVHEAKPANCAYTPLLLKRFLFDDQRMVSIIGKKTDFALLMCKGVGKGEARIVADTVRSTKMVEDIAFQDRVLLDLADELGRGEFMRISDAKRMGMLQAPDAEALRRAVEKVYGL